ncbi:12210_t:CDS:2 [Funneliformis geosporum]|nr:12210_t:CDS:2 [Funneliformis geosporum]
MDLIISLIDKSLTLSEATKQVLTNEKKENHTGFTKNLYHFLKKISKSPLFLHEFIRGITLTVKKNIKLITEFVKISYLDKIWEY